MNLRSLSMGLLGLGVLLVVFGFLVWLINKPDFQRIADGGYAASTQGRGLVLDPRRMEEERHHFKRIADENEDQYGRCLFSSSGGLCGDVQPVPYVNIFGLLLIVSGAGLLLVSRRIRSG